jgi:hypothetical protein
MAEHTPECCPPHKRYQVPADRNPHYNSGPTTTEPGCNHPRPDSDAHQGEHPLDRLPLFRHADLLGFRLRVLSLGISCSALYKRYDSWGE